MPSEGQHSWRSRRTTGRHRSTGLHAMLSEGQHSWRSGRCTTVVRDDTDLLAYYTPCHHRDSTAGSGTPDALRADTVLWAFTPCHRRDSTAGTPGAIRADTDLRRFYGPTRHAVSGTTIVNRVNAESAADSTADSGDGERSLRRLTVLPSPLWWRVSEVQIVRQAWPLGHVNFGSELMIKTHVTYCVFVTRPEVEKF